MLKLHHGYYSNFGDDKAEVFACDTEQDAEALLIKHVKEILDQDIDKEDIQGVYSFDDAIDPSTGKEYSITLMEKGEAKEIQVYVIRGADLIPYETGYRFNHREHAMMSMVNILGGELASYTRAGKKAKIDCVSYGIGEKAYTVMRLLDARDTIIFKLAIES